MKTYYLLTLCLTLLFSCDSKEDLSDAKRELMTFQADWLESGATIRQTLDSIKGDGQAANNFISRMQKVMQANKNLPAKSKTTLDSLISYSNRMKADFTGEINSFNQFTKQWNERRAELNNLKEAVESQEITGEVFEQKIQSLKDFRSSALVELQQISTQRDHFKVQLDSLKGVFTTAFPKLSKSTA